MDQLDLLCLLEDHYNLLLNYETQKRDLSDTYLNDEKNMTIIKLERNINVLKNKNKDTKEKLKKTEKSLKEYHYIIKEIENKLYSGNTSDIKQLQILSEEKNVIKDTISMTETKVLEYMEEIESTEDKLINMEVLLKDIIKQNHEKELKYIELDKKLNINIKDEKEKIEKIELDIDDKLLIKYKNIRKNNKTAVAKMQNDVCTGCNMGIPKYMVEKIKNSKDIICCENCGRILCKQKS